MLIVELKSEALKERHWKQLMRKLRVNWVLSDLSLGQIWDADLQKNEPAVKDIINVAQGEMALEEFLKQVISEILNSLFFVLLKRSCNSLFITFLFILENMLTSIAKGVSNMV